jgi:antirestriction protein
MQIYVANLAVYNNGTLKGSWIDVPTDASDLREAIAEIAGSDEWAIHDYDDAPYRFGEHPSLDDLARCAALIEEHGESATAAALSHEGGDVGYAADLLERGFREFVTPDEVDALAEYAEELADNGVLSKEFLLRYVDFARVGRDLQQGGDVTVVEADGSTFIFNC